MSIKKAICVIMIMVTLFAVALVAQQESKPYDYPVKPGTPGWKALTSLAQKQEVCQIPNSILSAMTTPDLLETCLNYPLYGNAMAYNSYQDGFEQVTKGFNGLQELLTRKDLGLACIEKYSKMDPDSMINEKWTSFKFFNIEILLAQDTVINNLSKSDRIKLLKESYKKYTAKVKHADVYGYLGHTNNFSLMSRILLKENYSPFVQSLSSNKGLSRVIGANGIDKGTDVKEIVKHVEKYLREN